MKTRTHRRRRDERGVALIIVLLAITLITAVVVQFSYDSHIDYSLAANEADEVRAYYLARSGIEFYKLILTADQKISGNDQLKQFLEAQGMGPIELWRMIPQIDTAMLRSVASPDVPDDQKEEMKKRFGGIAFDTLGKTDGFLDFEGDLHAEIEDEESKVDLNEIASEHMDAPLDSSVGRQLYAMTIDEKYDSIFDGTNALGERKLPREEVIGNLIDWVDPNQTQIMGGGAEDTLYANYEDRYTTKNAKFDTLAEVQMVRGIDDDFMQAFGRRITVFGSGKVNVNTCDEGTLASLILAYADGAIEATVAQKMAQQIAQYRDLAPFSKPTDFVSYVSDTLGVPLRKLPNQPTTLLEQHIDVQSKNFTIRSTGYAGEARVTITAVVDNTSPGSLRFLYWRVN